jgi:hypothetical protein
MGPFYFITAVLMGLIWWIGIIKFCDDAIRNVINETNVL